MSDQSRQFRPSTSNRGYARVSLRGAPKSGVYRLHLGDCLESSIPSTLSEEMSDDTLDMECVDYVRR